MCPEVTSLPLCHLETFNEIAVENVTKGSMAEVMDQTCDGHVSNLEVCDLQVWLGVSEDLDLLLSKVSDTNTMLKPSMATRWEHLVT